MQGNMRQTSNDLDLAIDGAGFFPSCASGRHDHVYATDPSRRDNVGNLVTGDGDQLTRSLPIPSGALKIDIGRDGTVSVLLPGVTRRRRSDRFSSCVSTIPPVLSRWAAICSSTVSRRDRRSKGTGGFSTGFGTLQQGFLESSNVNLDGRWST